MAKDVQTAVPVFVSYAHADAAALERLRVHLKPLFRAGNIACWDDGALKPGQRWRREIFQAIEAARVFVLLLSQDFLASDFINAEELPRILAAEERGIATVLTVYLKPLRGEGERLAALQAVNNPAKPMSALSGHEQEAVWVQLQEAVGAALSATRATVTPSARAVHSEPRSAKATSALGTGSPVHLQIAGIASPEEFQKSHFTPPLRVDPENRTLGQLFGRTQPTPPKVEPRFPPGIDSIQSIGYAPYDAMQRDWVLDEAWRRKLDLNAQDRGDGLLHIAELNAHVQMRLQIGRPGMTPGMADFEIRESRDMLAAMTKRQLQAVAYMTPHLLQMAINLRQRLSQTWMNDEHEKSAVSQQLLDRARMRWHAWGREHPDAPNGLANVLRELDQIATASGLH